MQFVVKDGDVHCCIEYMLNLWQHNIYVCHLNLVANFRLQSESEAMKLLRFAGLVFVFIATFQFVNIRYFGGAIFSLSSQDKFPVVSISGSIELVEPLFAYERLNVSSSRSVEVAKGEGTGLEEDNLIGSDDKNDTIQSRASFVEEAKDKEILDLLLETRSNSNGSYKKTVEDADMVFENSRKVETLEIKSDTSVENLSPEVKKLMKVSNSGVVSITEMVNLLHQSRTSHVSLVCDFSVLVSTTTATPLYLIIKMLLSFFRN